MEAEHSLLLDLSKAPDSDFYSTLMLGVWVPQSGFFVAAAFLLLLSLNPSFHTREMSVLLDTFWRRRGRPRREGHTCLKPSLPEPSPRGSRAWTEGPSLAKNTNLSGFFDQNGGVSFWMCPPGNPSCPFHIWMW